MSERKSRFYLKYLVNRNWDKRNNDNVEIDLEEDGVKIKFNDLEDTELHKQMYESLSEEDKKLLDEFERILNELF